MIREYDPRENTDSMRHFVVRLFQGSGNLFRLEVILSQGNHIACERGAPLLIHVESRHLTKDANASAKYGDFFISRDLKNSVNRCSTTD